MIHTSFQKQALKQLFNQIVQDKKTLEDLTELNNKLREKKLKDRPQSPESPGPQYKTEEYKAFVAKYKGADDELKKELSADEFYPVYVRACNLQEWKRYKSPEYKDIENRYKQHTDIKKLLNLTDT